MYIINEPHKSITQNPSIAAVEEAVGAVVVVAVVVVVVVVVVAVVVVAVVEIAVVAAAVAVAVAVPAFKTVVTACSSNSSCDNRHTNGGSFYNHHKDTYLK